MIELRQVSVHNLKNINLDLPYRKLIVVCGRSGSGKSSLALDTLYAEGQRRYIETFSPYARQFLEKFEKPSVERLDGIPPALAVTGKSGTPLRNASVGSVTEMADSVRLLFAKIGQAFCPSCGKRIQKDTPQSIFAQMNELFPRENAAIPERFIIAFKPPEKTEIQTRKAFVSYWSERGILRGVFCGPFANTPFRLGDRSFTDEPNKQAAGALTLFLDRVTLGKNEEVRWIDSLETAMNFGGGHCQILHEKSGSQQTWHFSNRLSCEACQFNMPELTPALFRSKKDEEETDRFDSQDEWSREALCVRIQGKNIHEVFSLEMKELDTFLRGLELSVQDQAIISQPLQWLVQRIELLRELGIPYLTLSRPLQTLSTGELRRVRLARILSSSLVNILYVFDEPTAGLHPANVEPLLPILEKLRNRGNTVILVEHNELCLLAADQIIELGPGGGESGGNITFHGTPRDMLRDPDSVTGAYLSGKRHRPLARECRRTESGHVTLTGCAGNHLKNLTVSFPLNVLCAVTGVSGAGKSSLVQKTLYPALRQHLGLGLSASLSPPLAFEKIFCDKKLEDVLLVDAAPPSRSPRSNAATYLKIFDEIRNVFSATLDAKAKNFSAGHFSFNVQGGRCEHCKGDGVRVIDMKFMGDVIVPCPVCHGKRYRAETLEIYYRDKNIADVLDLTVREAFGFFRGQGKVQQKLKRLLDVGLDYLKLGQPLRELSGGESQRLKLAAYLLQIKKGRSLLIFEEPTLGLHFLDVIQLLDCFDALIETGHSLIVVEHNLQLVRAADYVIDLGPGAAKDGGQIVAQGTPQEIAQNARSLTGKSLRDKLR